MKHSNEIWFNDLNPVANYKGIENSFIDVNNQKAVIEIIDNLEDCFLEMKNYLSTKEMDSYFNTSLVENSKDWKTIGLLAWSMPLLKKQKHFPKTMKIIKKYNEILTFSFNKLEPNSVIRPHCGDSNSTYRIHIGLDIPSGLPDCGFRVKDEKREWKYGNAFGFIDAFEHEAWNHTNKPRYIILIDIIRPEFKSYRTYICFRVLSSLLLQKIAYQFPIILKSPKWFKKGVLLLLSIPQKIINIFKI